LKSDPIVAEVPITLENMMRGCVKHLSVSRMVVHGFEVQRENKTFTLDIAPGTKENVKYTFAGQGHMLPGKKLGDVIFTIKQDLDSIFRREGDDLICTYFACMKSLTDSLYVKLPDRTLYLLGFHMSFPVHFTELRGVKEKRFPFLGFPSTKEPGKRGDLVVKFQITQTDNNESPENKEFPNFYFK
jgi:DnaJ family protein B protein 4